MPTPSLLLILQKLAFYVARFYYYYFSFFFVTPFSLSLIRPLHFTIVEGPSEARFFFYLLSFNSRAVYSIDATSLNALVRLRLRHRVTTRIVTVDSKRSFVCRTQFFIRVCIGVYRIAGKSRLLCRAVEKRKNVTSQRFLIFFARYSI